MSSNVPEGWEERQSRSTGKIIDHSIAQMHTFRECRIISDVGELYIKFSA